MGGPTSNKITRETLGYQGSGNSLVYATDRGIYWRSRSDVSRIQDKVKHYSLDGHLVEGPAWVWEDPNHNVAFKANTENKGEVKGLQTSDYVKITHLARSPYADAYPESQITIFDGLHGLGTRAVIDVLRNSKVLDDMKRDLEKLGKRYQNQDHSYLMSYEAICKVKIENTPDKTNPERKGKSTITGVKYVQARPFKLNI